MAASSSRAAGGDPIRSYLHIARASFGSLGVLSDTIVKATPILLAALACSVAFRMRLWNIGAEGQFIMGAFGASAIILAPVLPARDLALDLHSGDDPGRHGRRGRLGLHPGLSQGHLQRQRDHQLTDDQLHRGCLGELLDLRRLDRRRFPDEPHISQDRLAAPAAGLCQERARVRAG